MTLFRTLAICCIGVLLLLGCAKQQIKRPAAGNLSKSRLTLINQYYNLLVQYKEEHDTDHWQSPNETRQLGSGDCEDIAIAKMHDPVLRRSFPAEQIRLSYVYTPDGQPHMVLFIGTGKEILVMDNLYDKAIPLAESGYRPLYQLDAAGRVYRNNVRLESHPGFEKFDAILATL